MDGWPVVEGVRPAPRAVDELVEHDELTGVEIGLK
jgi:hypothetical protein